MDKNKQALDAFKTWEESDAADFLDSDEESFFTVAEKVWVAAYEAALTVQSAPVDAEVQAAVEIVRRDFFHCGGDDKALETLIRAATKTAVPDHIVDPNKMVMPNNLCAAWVSFKEAMFEQGFGKSSDKALPAEFDVLDILITSIESKEAK